MDHLARDLDDDVEVHVRLVVAPRTRPDVADLDGLDELRILNRQSLLAISLVPRLIESILHKGRNVGVPHSLRPVVGVHEGLALLAPKRDQTEGPLGRCVGVNFQVRTRGVGSDDRGVAGDIEAAGKREGLHSS